MKTLFASERSFFFVFIQYLPIFFASYNKTSNPFYALFATFGWRPITMASTFLHSFFFSLPFFECKSSVKPFSNADYKDCILDVFQLIYHLMRWYRNIANMICKSTYIRRFSVFVGGFCELDCRPFKMYSMGNCLFFCIRRKMSVAGWCLFSKLSDHW